MLAITGFCVTERSERLTRAFRESGFAANGLSARQTAIRNHWNIDTFKSNLNGNAPFSFDQAKRYAEKFKVRAEWLYDGTGEMREPPKQPDSGAAEIPLLSWVSAGQAADIGDVAELGEAERLIVGGLPRNGQFFATEVRGDSMDRVSPEGSRIIVNTAERNPKAGQFYLFSHRGEPTYKRYQSRPVRRLEPFSTNPAHETIFLGDKEWTVIGRVVRSMIDLA